MSAVAQCLMNFIICNIVVLSQRAFLFSLIDTKNAVWRLLRNTEDKIGTKLWQILKTRVEKQVNEKQTVTVEVFRGVIQKEWEEIDQSTYVNLVRSMPTRLNEIIEGNGNKINY